MTLPTLLSILNVFGPMRHLQSALESSKAPTLFFILPMLEHLKFHISQLAQAFVVNQHVPGPAVRYFSETSLKHLKARILTHDLFISACILHPSLLYLSFIDDITERSHMRVKGLPFIQNLYNVSRVKNGSVHTTIS